MLLWSGIKWLPESFCRTNLPPELDSWQICLYVYFGEEGAFVRGKVIFKYFPYWCIMYVSGKLICQWFYFPTFKLWNLVLNSRFKTIWILKNLRIFCHNILKSSYLSKIIIIIIWFHNTMKTIFWTKEGNQTDFCRSSWQHYKPT